MWEVSLTMKGEKFILIGEVYALPCPVYTISAREILQTLFCSSYTARFIWSKGADPRNNKTGLLAFQLIGNRIIIYIMHTAYIYIILKLSK